MNQNLAFCLKTILKDKKKNFDPKFRFLLNFYINLLISRIFESNFLFNIIKKFFTF